ncbi:MAG: PAS domain-containing protein [Bacteroidota bacterium]|nr:PAS domain-containing protein [Bacteroidota bacterium]
MINYSLFYNTIEPSFILNDNEIVDFNPAFKMSFKLIHNKENYLQFSDILPQAQANGKCSIKLLKEIICNTFNNGNTQQSILFKNGMGKNIQSDITFTAFISNDQQKLIYGVCRNINDKKDRLSLNNNSKTSKEKEKHSIKDNNVEHLLKEIKNIKLVENNVKEEETSKKIEEKFKMLAEATPAVIMQFDTFFRHTYVNSNVKDLTGIPSEEFIGKTYEEMNFPLPFVDHFKSCLQRVIDTKRETREEFLLPNGKHVDWHLVPILDPNKETQSIITSIHDITSLKKVEDEVRQAKEKLSDAMKMAQLSTWEYDLDTREMILSPDFYEAYGITYHHKITGAKLLAIHEHP